VGGSRTVARVLVSAFVVIVWLPLAANIAGVDGADPGAENRELAPFPSLEATSSSIAAFPSRLDTWFEDHFGFRARLVRWHGQLRYRLLHVSPTKDVVRGKDGWLFYGGDYGLEDYVAELPLPSGEVANWRDAVVRARDWLRSHGIAYVFTIAPDKHVIYPEQFPDTVRPAGTRRRMDQVLSGIADTGVSVDVRPALLAAKPRERLYHRTDTHWNARGAYVAYREIIDAVRRQAPDVGAARRRSDFEDTSRYTEGLDLAGMMGLKDVLREEELGLLPVPSRRARVVEPEGADPTAEEGRLVTEIAGSTLPRAVVFRDSFGSALVPFLSEHFSRTVYLWQNDFTPDAVLRERPDVVIQEIVGRHLYSFIPSPELIPER
jgi:hypothetical protein